MENRESKMEAVAQDLEQGFELLGATAIEDADVLRRFGRQAAEGLPFLRGDVFVSRVRQHKERVLVRAILAVEISQHGSSVAENVP